MDAISNLLIPALAIVVVVVTMIRRWGEPSESPFKEVCGEQLLPGEEVTALQQRLNQNPSSEQDWWTVLSEIKVLLPEVKARLQALEDLEAEHGLDNGSLIEARAARTAIQQAEALIEAPEQALAMWRDNRDANLMA